MVICDWLFSFKGHLSYSVSRLDFFLLLNNIPFMGSPHFLISSAPDGYLGYFHFLSVRNTAFNICV